MMPAPLSFHAFLVRDSGHVELPNHDAAIANLDWTNIHLKIVRDGVRTYFRDDASWIGG